MLRLPSTIYDLANPVELTTGLRACGMGAWRHLPIRIERLISIRVEESTPFWVIFSGNSHTAMLVSEWSKSQQFRPLHISSVEVPGAIPVSEMTIERLRAHFNDLISDNESHLGEFRAVVDRWSPREPIVAAFPFFGHQTVEPNQACLTANGVVGTEFVAHWRGSTDVEFEDAIARTFAAVEELWARTPAPSGIRLMPPRPTTWLISTARLPNLRSKLMKFAKTSTDRTAITDFAIGIERQRSFVVVDDPIRLERLNSSPAAKLLYQIRRIELGIFFDAIGWALAGSAAGAWRIKPMINAVQGAITQFSENVRAEANTPQKKIIKLFEAVQTKIQASVDPRAVQAIHRADWGVKIISDMPVEWLPAGRLPLGLHRDVSRLTATPSELLLRQLETHEMLRIGVGDFNEVLIVSTFADGHEDDVIARLLEQIFNIKRVTPRLVRVRTEAQLVDAVNAYGGPLMIFDGHGVHPSEEEGYLVVGDERVWINRLEGKIRVPPIVVLSACDTHAAARSTQTAANMMLRLGARTVLATNLPIRFANAAIMVGDIIRTIDNYLPDMPADVGRVVRWSEFIGGILRSHFIMDVFMQIATARKMDPKVFDEFLPRVLLAARFSTGEVALEMLEVELLKRGLVDSQTISSIVRHVVATSDSIRYIQLGNPETIMIGSVEDLSASAKEEFDDMEVPPPVWKFDGNQKADEVDVMEILGYKPYGKWREDRGK